MTLSSTHRRPLQDRVVVVTGATAGIGSKTAQRLARRGATVVACARDADALSDLVAGSGRVVPRRCDLSRDDERADLVTWTATEMGRIDALICNVGIGMTAAVTDMAVEQIRKLVETNVTATIDLTRLVLPVMTANGGGDVVLLSSAASWCAMPPLTVYSATKYAVAGFAEGLRREVAHTGIRVHSIHPSFVSTQFAARSAGEDPGEVDGDPADGPGVPPEWVAAAIERALTRRGRRAVAVPRLVGATRAVKLPGVAHLTDLVIAGNAERLLRTGRDIAQRAAHAGAGGRTPGS